MIDELLNTVTQKTGLTPDQAKAAIETVIGLLKQRLPAPVASSLDSVVSGEASSDEGAGDVAGKASGVLGSMFGKKS